MQTIYQLPTIEQQRIPTGGAPEYKDRTPPPRLTTADLMGHLRTAQSKAEAGNGAAAFEAVFGWAMRQNFDDDYAARVRREAWGHRDTQ